MLALPRTFLGRFSSLWTLSIVTVIFTANDYVLVESQTCQVLLENYTEEDYSRGKGEDLFYAKTEMLTLQWTPAIYYPPFTRQFLTCLREVNKCAKVTVEWHKVLLSLNPSFCSALETS